MARDVSFRCKCGRVQGNLRGVGPGAGCHLVCYCADCRAAARHLGQLDQLLPGGGSALYQTLSSRATIDLGGEYIACLRLSPKGLHRWYAACCNRPLANTVGTAKMPFIGFWRPVFSDPAALGPVQSHGFTKYALREPGAPTKDRGMAIMAWGMLRRTAMAYATGTVYPHPFFNPDGTPLVTPAVLDPSQRAAAYRDP
ncbi:DUF6151 family protein [Oceaniglobus ichthyenteri]|uniref:DUF6151 family protein n=1 Tax=Oceaniglobus ichthyenteri TaxID=2136177 RepID=UPI000D3566F2|nr:DUF6151 family protein [Oceaniglobus ichthyenteri]